MPRGLDAVSKAIENKSAKYGSFTERFRLPKDGDSAIVRFLEQGNDIAWAYVYQLPAMGGRSFGSYVASLDQENDGTPCPFRDAVGGAPRIRAYMNVIWRDAPKFKREENGSFIKDSSGNRIQEGVEDRVVVWEASQTVLRTLISLDADLKGLSSRDFKVIRQGESLKTTYTIYPAGDAKPLSPEDEKLAENKYDLNEFVVPVSYDDAVKMVNGESSTAESSEEAISRAQDANIFLKN